MHRLSTSINCTEIASLKVSDVENANHVQNAFNYEYVSCCCDLTLDLMSLMRWRLSPQLPMLLWIVILILTVQHRYSSLSYCRPVSKMWGWVKMNTSKNHGYKDLISNTTLSWKTSILMVPAWWTWGWSGRLSLSCSATYLQRASPRAWACHPRRGLTTSPFSGWCQVL